MNSYVGVSIYDTKTDLHIANSWIDSAFDEIKRVEEMIVSESADTLALDTPGFRSRFGVRGSHD